MMRQSATASAPGQHRQCRRRLRHPRPGVRRGARRGHRGSRGEAGRSPGRGERAVSNSLPDRAASEYRARRRRRGARSAGIAVRNAPVDRQGRAADRRHGRVGRLGGGRGGCGQCAAWRTVQRSRNCCRFALEGERVASDPPHWDNVMASLLGGLVLAASEKPALVQRAAGPRGRRRHRAASRSEGRDANGAIDPHAARCR